MRGLKLDFPRFDGTNVLHWIFQSEQFFELYQVPEDQKVVVAGVHFEPNVLPWFQMVKRNNPLLSWQWFARALEMEFGPSPYDSPRVAMYKLFQQGSVQEYHL